MLSLCILFGLCPAEWGGLAEIEGEDKLIQSGEEMEPIGCCVPEGHRADCGFEDADGGVVFSDGEVGRSRRRIHVSLNSVAARLGRCT